MSEQTEKLAREAGMYFAGDDFPEATEVEATRTQLARFAALVRADERERCAKVCDDMVLYTGFDCAAALRSGEATNG